MRKLIGITGVVAGLLLIIVPRYVLPACEYTGFSRMYCTDTANAEMITGILLMAAGAAVFFLKRESAVPAGSVAVFVLSSVAWVLPDQFGFCRSSRMPCNYGMVPGIRFVAAAGALAAIFVFAAWFKNHRRKGSA